MSRVWKVGDRVYVASVDAEGRVRWTHTEVHVIGPCGLTLRDSQAAFGHRNCIPAELASETVEEALEKLLAREVVREWELRDEHRLAENAVSAIEHELKRVRGDLAY